MAVARVLAAGDGRGLVEPACGRFTQKYEIEEEIYLRLDGSATVNVNASVAALVALRGVDLPVDPKARLDRERVRALLQIAGSPPPRLTSRDATAGGSCTSASTFPTCGSCNGSGCSRGPPTGSTRESDSLSIGSASAARQARSARGRLDRPRAWSSSRCTSRARFRITTRRREDGARKHPEVGAAAGSAAERRAARRGSADGAGIDSLFDAAALRITIVAAAITFGVVIWWVGGAVRDSEAKRRAVLRRRAG